MSLAGAIKSEGSHIWKRAEGEHYVEPEWCSRRLFDVEGFEGSIWDPCCGFGRIPEAAKAAGYAAYGSDLSDRGYGDVGQDFLLTDFPHTNIVCNPPFDQFRAFATRALERATRKVAMIWMVRRLPAARWLQDTPLTRIYWLTPRPSMPPGHVIAAGEKPKGGKQDFCWLVWEKPKPITASFPQMRWLHRDKPTGEN